MAQAPRPFPKNKIKVLLLEGLHADSVQRLREEGYAVECRKGALDEPELTDAIADVHLLGIRSKTQVTEKALGKARRLLAVGAFCIGTNQIDLEAAKHRGVPVFNAPYSNTRSVAELVIANVIILFRRLYDRIHMAHEGRWDKSAAGSIEVRNKTIGIIGYGHIGRQVSVLAEALGMRVIYYDIADRLAMGNASPAADMRDLLEQAHVVTLHVPATKDTEGMIGAAELARMRPGACLINTSRGSVVDLQAVREALLAKKLGGAAVDVFPEEPKSDEDAFVTPLQGLPNVVITPHIGGSTQEAQRNIGLEVAAKLVRFTNNGSTEGAVNFPNVVLPELVEHHRILHIHQNVPGVLQQVNALFGKAHINVAAQYLRTYEDIGYLIMDVERIAAQNILRDLAAMPESIKVRALY